MFQTAVSSTLPSFVPEAQALLEEILQDGVLIRAGGSILFSHLSFQEYLAGKQLHADPSGTAAKSAIGWFLKGDDWWKEPVAFYIGSAENPTDMKAWLDRVAASTAAQHGINDFPQRRLFLYATLEESFEGYKV
jgi:predicted NACHT family NTPase